MEDKLNRRSVLRATATGIVGTIGTAGTASATHIGIHDPCFTAEGRAYIHNSPTAGDHFKYVGEKVGLYVEQGPEVNDGYKWWYCRVNGDQAWEADVKGWVAEKEMVRANFGYPTLGRLSSDHDDCRDNCSRLHGAADIAGDVGELVVAARGGTVDLVRDDGDTGYGKWVQIDHGQGWKTRYAHLSDFHVSYGDTVGMFDHVGALGNTGSSTGPHTHFEIRLNGTKLDWTTREDAYIARGTGVPRDFA